MEQAAEQVCGFVFDLDPTIIDFRSDLGIDVPFQLRYYGIIFAAMLYIGFVIWRRQMLRGGFKPEVADRFLIWAVVAVIVGARLGHCLFYDPQRYLSNPIEILYFWHGGLASHGATIGLVLALFLFSLWHKFHFFEALDRFGMSAAVGAAAVRLGNFFNSEIVGRETDVPWSFYFVRHDRMIGVEPVCRHPSQLYEFALGMLVLLSCYLADRFAGKEKRPLGLVGGMFFLTYFSGRFFVEFVKEYQTLSDSVLTMGQYLSIIPFLFGVFLVGYALVTRRVTADLRPPPVEEEESDEQSDESDESDQSDRSDP
jgi:prolipoprotein diacylglyceryl transferase